MKNKNWKKIVFLAISMLLLVNIGLGFAQTEHNLEVTYPTTTNVRPPQGVNTFLPRYIKYIYHFSIIAGVIIALMSLIYGGFRFLTSAGNPSATIEARAQILAGFLGLAILLGSYVMLIEINPDLVSLKVPSPTGVRSGVILYSGADCSGLGSSNEAALPELVDLPDEVKYMAMRGTGSTILGRGLDGVANTFPKSVYSFHNSGELVLELYGDENCNGTTLGSVKNLQANVCSNLTLNAGDEVKCIKFVWYTPGVWVFNQLDGGKAPNPKNLPTGWQEGRQYMIFQDSQDTLPGNFHDKIKAMAIIPDTKLEMNYGVILHNIPGGYMKEKGWADIYLPGTGSGTGCTTDSVGTTSIITICKTAPGGDRASSLTVFPLPNDNKTASYPIQLCRNDSCESQRIGKKWYPADLWLIPGMTTQTNSQTPGQTGMEDITSFFGSGGGQLFCNTEGIIYATTLRGERWNTSDTWSGGTKIELIKNHDDGVSAVMMEQKTRYLALLYEKNFGKWDDINRNHNSDAAIINQSLPSARTITMDGRTGTIILIRTGY